MTSSMCLDAIGRYRKADIFNIFECNGDENDNLTEYQGDTGKITLIDEHIICVKATIVILKIDSTNMS